MVTRRTIRRVAAIAIMGGIGVGAFLAGRSTARPTVPAASQRSTSTTTKPGGKDTSGRPTVTSPPATSTSTVEGANLPMLMDCSNGPLFKPTSLQWCQSMCSSYMQGISWRNWGTSRAIGVGTLVTRTTTVTSTTPNAIAHSTTGAGIVSCEQAKTVYHSGTPVVLSNPMQEKICVNGKEKSLWLFTKVTPPGIATPTNMVTRRPCRTSG